MFYYTIQQCQLYMLCTHSSLRLNIPLIRESPQRDVPSYLDSTAIQFSTHTDMAAPGQWMDSDEAGMKWREDVVNKNGILIKVAPENLQ